MDNVKIGDVVILNSGGPKMTVSKTGLPKRMVVCQWFDGKNMRTETFPLDGLQVAASTIGESE